MAILRAIPGAACILIVAGAAGAQVIFPGSTPVGDYLRGVGVAAAGVGIYNERTAVANRINAETFILLNEYMWNVVKNEMRENAEHRRAILARHAEARRRIEERIRDRPEPYDVRNGDALNALVRSLPSSRLGEREGGKAGVRVPADWIRRIPFRLGEKGETFSMARLTLRGKRAKWVVAFQDPRFAAGCRAYERAVDDALERAMEGRMIPGAIKDLQDSVEFLRLKVHQTPELHDPRNQREYSEAKAQLDRLGLAARLFQTFAMQSIFKEIDTYTGTGVDDLLRFMRRHGLQFAEAETPDERELYPQLYKRLVQHRDG